MKVKSFTIYEEFYELITLLTEKEEKEQLSLALLEYMFENKKPTLNDRQMKIFVNLKRPLDKSKNRSKSGSNKKQNKNKTETNEKQKKNKTETHQDVYVYVNGNVNVIKDIINYLNKKTNSNFKYSTKSTQQKINARLNEGYKLDDFIAVIDKKYDEWRGTEFEKYLCPETLFGNKFEKYLNQKIKTKEVTEEQPWWYGKEIEEEQASSEEVAKLEEMLCRQ